MGGLPERFFDDRHRRVAEVLMRLVHLKYTIRIEEVHERSDDRASWVIVECDRDSSWVRFTFRPSRNKVRSWVFHEVLAQKGGRYREGHSLYGNIDSILRSEIFAPTTMLLPETLEEAISGHATVSTEPDRRWLMPGSRSVVHWVDPI